MKDTHKSINALYVPATLKSSLEHTERFHGSLCGLFKESVSTSPINVTDKFCRLLQTNALKASFVDFHYFSHTFSDLITVRQQITMHVY